MGGTERENSGRRLSANCKLRAFNGQVLFTFVFRPDQSLRQFVPRSEKSLALNDLVVNVPFAIETSLGGLKSNAF